MKMGGPSYLVGRPLPQNHLPDSLSMVSENLLLETHYFESLTNCPVIKNKYPSQTSFPFFFPFVTWLLDWQIRECDSYSGFHFIQALDKVSHNFIADEMADYRLGAPAIC